MKRAAYTFGWKYPPSVNEHFTATTGDNVERPLLPTDPYLTCEWGDAKIEPEGKLVQFAGSEPEDRLNINFTDTVHNRFLHVAHEYEKHNEYDINCTMWNHVSRKSLSQSVRVFILATTV